MTVCCCNPTCAAGLILTEAKTDSDAVATLRPIGWVFHYDPNEGLLAHCPRCAREAA